MPPEERTLEQEFPNLSKVFDFWTFEGDLSIHTTADCLKILIFLIDDSADGRWSAAGLLNTLRGALYAAEAAAKNAKPYLDEWEAERPLDVFGQGDYKREIREEDC